MLSQVFWGFPNSTKRDFNLPASPGAIVLLWAQSRPCGCFAGSAGARATPLTSVALWTVLLPLSWVGVRFIISETPVTQQFSRERSSLFILKQRSAASHDFHGLMVTPANTLFWRRDMALPWTVLYFSAHLPLRKILLFKNVAMLDTSPVVHYSRSETTDKCH